MRSRARRRRTRSPRRCADVPVLLTGQIMPRRAAGTRAPDIALAWACPHTRQLCPTGLAGEAPVDDEHLTRDVAVGGIDQEENGPGHIRGLTQPTEWSAPADLSQLRLVEAVAHL